MDSSGGRYNRPTAEVKIKKLVYTCFRRHVHQTGGNHPGKKQTSDNNRKRTSQENYS